MKNNMINSKYFTINRNGCSIRSKLYFIDPGSIRRVVISGHGFAGDKDNSSTQKLVDRMLLNNKDTAFVTFDWPGHGEDSRRLCLADCVKYLGTVTEYVKETWQPKQLCAYGISFGAYTVLNYLAAEPCPFDRVVLRSPAVNMLYVLTENIMTEAERTLIERRKDALVGFAKKVRVTPEYVEEVRSSDIMHHDFHTLQGRLLLLHGREDEIVPPEAVRQFAADNGLDLLEFEHSDHRFRDAARMSEALDYTVEFFTE